MVPQTAASLPTAFVGSPPILLGNRTVDPDQRRQLIVDLIQQQEIRSQQQLQGLLADRGIEVNQATLSRDLRHIGATKGATGYRLDISASYGEDHFADLHRTVNSFLRSATIALNQVVLKTPPGGASALAMSLDAAKLEEVLGTIAGDDTILIITRSTEDAAQLAARLEGMLAPNR